MHSNALLQIKGVDHQPGGSGAVGTKVSWDPLADAEECARDIAMFKKLGINTIRVYSIDPKLNHDECMTMLAAAGIYLVLDVNSPLEFQHMHATEPWTTYHDKYLEHIFTVMEIFSGYDNLLGFLAGNEIVHLKGSEKTAPQYIKAVVRDMRAYSEKHLKRQVPIGYSNADDIKFRVSLAQFLECGEEGYVDFFGVNSYQWCGEQTFESSGYDSLVKDYSDYSLPVFFTEYGCNEIRPRKWQEVEALYSEKMTGVFSGGLVYEMTQEEADYGLVQIDDDGNVELLEEFDLLAEAFSKVPKDIKIPSNVKINERPTKCGTPSQYKGITANNTLPATLGADLIENGVSKNKFTVGKLGDLSSVKTSSKYTITESSGEEVDPEKLPSSNTGSGDEESSASGLKVASGLIATVAAAISYMLI